jgi:uncharacterized protein (TIGR00299 family) protein
MKTLYLECSMGAAGDMLTAALLELIPDKNEFIDKMNALGVPGVRVSAVPSVKCGIVGTRVSVTVGGVEEESEDILPGHSLHGNGHDHGHKHEHHAHEHHAHDHVDMREIERLIGQLPLPERVAEDALAVYRLIAEAESHVHGRPVEEIHFHEVGTMDAVADIVGVCLLMDTLAPESVLASPIHTGSGQVRCAHGILPVPAPAAAYLLRGIPTYGGAVKGELCTPTGAALLKHFVSDFGDMPVMKASKIGYGMGKKDFEAANCVRALFGESGQKGDEIVELCCNLDDMTPEAIGFAQERLFEGGALDVYTTAIGMKKCRPGVLLSCMCREKDREAMIRLIFRHTTTLGIRETVCRRYTLGRTEHMEETKYGPVKIKTAEGWGVKREKAEYEDLAEIARRNGLSFLEAEKLRK